MTGKGRPSLGHPWRHQYPLEPGQASSSAPDTIEERRRAMRRRLTALSGHHWEDADADAQRAAWGALTPVKGGE